MGFPLYFTCWFSLAAFNMLSLCLIFVSLISNVSQHVSPWVLCGTLCTYCTWLTISFSMFMKFSTIWKYFFKNFIIPFLFIFVFGTPIIQMLVHLIFPRGLWDYTQFFSFFLLYSAFQQLFPPLYLPVQWFVLLQTFCYWFMLESIESIE